MSDDGLEYCLDNQFSRRYVPDFVKIITRCYFWLNNSFYIFKKIA